MFQIGSFLATFLSKPRTKVAAGWGSLEGVVVQFSLSFGKVATNYLNSVASTVILWIVTVFDAHLCPVRQYFFYSTKS
jgi:hypothetical protein